ncbi:MAG: hypothetical protein EOO38_08885 [Cytophagaceae bacterium]|nr:MAG: hypothetical protein EOO38_08885 [Cytophagaceae bacterium]
MRCSSAHPLLVRLGSLFSLLLACSCGDPSLRSATGGESATDNLDGAADSNNFRIDPNALTIIGQPNLSVAAVSDGSFTIQRTAAPSKCLDVRGASTADGTPVIFWDCNGGNNQRWKFQDGHLVVYGNKCLALEVPNASNFTKVVIRDCAQGAATQVWNRQGDHVVFTGTGRCLDLPFGNTANGTQFALFDCGDTDINEKFTFTDASTSQLVLTPGSTLDDVCTPQVGFALLDSTSNGAAFNKLIPDAASFVQQAARDVCKTLYRNPSEVPNTPRVNIVIRSYPTGVAYTTDDTITLSAEYVGRAANPSGGGAYEIKGVLVHEMTHVYQQDNGAYSRIAWLIEGVADYTRYRTGYFSINNRHKGGKYTDSYQTTGFFLDYLDRRSPGFAYNLNQSLGNLPLNTWQTDYIANYFKSSVDQLWLDYQDSF